MFEIVDKNTAHIDQSQLRLLCDFIKVELSLLAFKRSMASPLIFLICTIPQDQTLWNAIRVSVPDRWPLYNNLASAGFCISNQYRALKRFLFGGVCLCESASMCVRPLYIYISVFLTTLIPNAHEAIIIFSCNIVWFLFHLTSLNFSTNFNLKLESAVIICPF